MTMIMHNKKNKSLMQKLLLDLLHKKKSNFFLFIFANL